jgi:predicted nucleotidyltransferase
MIDLSNRVLLKPLARLLSAVREAADATPILLVGAAARDLLLAHVHGIDPKRATEDTDVALAIRDWSMFVGFDLEEAGAWLLGKDAREVLAHGREPQASLESLHAILGPEIDAEGALRLVGQMPSGDRDRQLALRKRGSRAR